MVEIAGGQDVLGRKWADSVRVLWDDIARAAPEVLIVMPCGLDSAQAEKQAAWLKGQPDWNEIPAVRDDRVYAVDGGYFSRPGPRIVDGTELLAHLMDPDRFSWDGPAGVYRRITGFVKRDARET